MPQKAPSEKFLWLNGPNGRLAAMLHEAPSKKIVVMAHGFTGHKGEGGRLFVETARAFATAGINALRFDFYGSGDSEGDFNQMTPNTEIADLLATIAWARKRYSTVGVLGLSFGGGVSICSCAQTSMVDALVLWSTVPSFDIWRSEPPKGENPKNPHTPGRRFYVDRPKIDVPEAFLSLTIPKLHIQGDQDIPGFREKFSAYFPDAQPVKKHLVLAGADHVFTQGIHRRKVISESVKWMQKYLPE